MEKKRVRKRYIILLSVLALLVAGRLLLPYFVTRYVNKVLAEIPGYWGKIDDVDISLYRGAYQIQGMELYKVEGNDRIPFLDFPEIDLSVYWKALLKGKVAGEVAFNRPVINFIGGGSESESQSGTDTDWTEPLKDLMPLQIDKLTTTDGKITFNDFSTRPRVDLSMTNVDLTATNLSNAEQRVETLPSDVRLTATSIGNGKLDVNMQANVLKPTPDFDLDLRFENVNIPALNDFFKAYAKVDLERGTFNLYSELALREGVVKGYVKPVARDLKFIDWKDKDEFKNPVHLAWEGLAGLVAEIFENQPKDQLATVIPVSGTLEKTNVDVWTTLANVLRNAFVKSLSLSTDGTITFADAIQAYRDQLSGKSGNKADKEERKAERQERREERKEKRQQRREERRQEKEKKQEAKT